MDWTPASNNGSVRRLLGTSVKQEACDEWEKSYRWGLKLAGLEPKVAHPLTDAFMCFS